MKKIPTVLVRNPEDRAHVLDQITPGCEWVIAGEGTPTRKFDGTCVMKDDAGWWARREVKQDNDVPTGFVHVDHDFVTGKTVGWVPIATSSFYRWFLEAIEEIMPTEHGTYELIGPRINGDPDRAGKHMLIRHGAITFDNPAEHTIDAIKDLVAVRGRCGNEGIVWHHPDGRMAKLKARDLTT